jgi:hypothetical protein
LNKLPLFRRRNPPTKEEVQRLLLSETRGGKEMSRQQFIHFCQVQSMGVGRAVLISLCVMFIVCPLLGALLKRALAKHGPIAHLVPKVPDNVFVLISGAAFSKFQAWLQHPRHRVVALYTALHVAVLGLAYTYSHLLTALLAAINANGVVSAVRAHAAEAGSRLDAALGMRAVHHR